MKKIKCEHILRNIETKVDGSVFCNNCGVTIEPPGSRKFYTKEETKNLIEQYAKGNFCKQLR